LDTAVLRDLKKRLLFNALAATLSAFMTLAVAEVVLQVVDLPRANFSPWIRADDTAFRYAPNLHTRMARPPEYDVPFETNSMGFRDDEIGPKHGPRILLLGDSFASGYGVERPHIFADLLERELGVEVVNAGVGGYEIIHQVQYFSSRGSALKPDLVVYALYLGNDLARNGEWELTGNGHLVAKKRDFPVRVHREFKLWRLLKMLRYQMVERAVASRGPWEPFPDYLEMCARDLDAQAAANYATVEDLLRELRDRVHKAGSELVVAFFSYRTAVDPQAEARFSAEIPNFDERYDLGRPEHEVRAILDRLGIDYDDLNIALRSYYQEHGQNAPPLYFRSDGHFTAAGHRLVADALAGWLRGRPELRRRS
jgi:lysophospholipase L1-like esterase